jgi:hypothetical protein
MWTSAPLVVGDRVVVGTTRGPVSFPASCTAAGRTCDGMARTDLRRAKTSSISPLALVGRDRILVDLEAKGSRLAGFALVDGDCSARMCDPTGRWWPTIDVQRIEGVRGDVATAWTISELVGVSVPRAGRPHVVWRWRHPRASGGGEVVLARRCSTYVAIRQSLYAIRTC